MSRTILLADDSVTIQKVIELTFMDEDYEVVAVSNGDDAMERLGSSTPDFVIADVHMPGASGYEVARRAKDLHPAVPVLLLVGTFEPFDEAEAKKSGADSFLKKPFDSQELLRLVGELATKGAGAPAPAAGSPPPPAPPSEAPPSPVPPAAEEALRWEEPEALRADRPAVEESFTLDEDTFEVEDAEAEPFRLDAQEVVPAPEDEPFALPSVPGSESPPAGPEEEPFSFAEERPSPAAVEASPPPPPQTEPEPAAPEAAVSPVPAGAAVPAAPAPGNHAGGLSDDEVERIARRVAEMIGPQVLREVAWEVIPDLAEVIIRDRLRELESQVD